MLTVTGDFAGAGCAERRRLAAQRHQRHAVHRRQHRQQRGADAERQRARPAHQRRRRSTSRSWWWKATSAASNVKAGSIVAGNVNFNANNFLDLKVGVNTHLNARQRFDRHVRADAGLRRPQRHRRDRHRDRPGRAQPDGGAGRHLPPAHGRVLAAGRQRQGRVGARVRRQGHDHAGRAARQPAGHATTSRSTRPTRAWKRASTRWSPTASSSAPACRSRAASRTWPTASAATTSTAPPSAVTSPGSARTACTPTSRTAGCISTPT